MEEIPISHNEEFARSTKSQSENNGNGSDEREENCVNFNSEARNEGASCSKEDVHVSVGENISKEAPSDSSAAVKIEETAMLVPESCSKNKASPFLGRNANGAVMPRIGRSSTYHGVTRHRWSGKYEAHLWDNTCRIEGHRRKGRQVYLGSYDTEEKAARAYDVAALKFWGTTTKLNFPVPEYEKELEDVRNMSKDACVTYIRRRSSCFSRGTSAFRGVTKRRKDGRWQARIGLVCGSRDIYLGTFKSEEEAAEAYDIAAVKLRGKSAITNFDISNYVDMSPDNRE